MTFAFVGWAIDFWRGARRLAQTFGEVSRKTPVAGPRRAICFAAAAKAPTPHKTLYCFDAARTLILRNDGMTGLNEFSTLDGQAVKHRGTWGNAIGRGPKIKKTAKRGGHLHFYSVNEYSILRIIVKRILLGEIFGIQPLFEEEILWGSIKSVISTPAARGPAMPLVNPLGDFRQAGEDYVANSFQTLWTDFVERVLRGVPVNLPNVSDDIY